MKQINFLKKTLLAVALLLGGTSSVWAETINVTTSDNLANKVANASDGDVILMDDGTYTTEIKLPASATITLKAKNPGQVTYNSKVKVKNYSYDANGGLIFDGLIIKPTDAHFFICESTTNAITIKKIAFRNCEITSEWSGSPSKPVCKRGIIIANATNFSIKDIELTNCKIHDLGTEYALINVQKPIESIKVKNCTIYNYGGGRFLHANALIGTALTFEFINNTVYKVGTAAFCDTGTNFTKDTSYFTFKDNIFYKGYGVTDQKVLNATCDNITFSNNIIEDFSGETQSKLSLSTDLDIDGTIPFASTDAGSEDFTLNMTEYPKLQSKATAADANHAGVLGDPRWAKFTLDESKNYTPVNANGVKVALTRGITKDKWSSIVLPFDIASDDIATVFGAGASVAELSSGDTNTLSFTTTLTDNKMKANQPYAIKVASDFESATIEGVTIVNKTPTQTIDNWQFVGTYSLVEDLESGNYYFKDNYLYQATGTQKIKPFRGYFHYTGSAAAARDLNFIIDEEPTALTLVNSEKQIVNSEVYDLQGRKVAQPTKGLYIVNGKKVVIK